MAATDGSDGIAGIVVHTRLDDGRKVCIRAIRADDEPRMRSGIAELSDQSRYLRFFTSAPALPDPVVAGLVRVDGHRHLGWGAILSDQPDLPAIGAVHAVRDDAESPTAEFAIGVLDAYHGLGLARMLVAVLLIHCGCEGIERIEAQVLHENKPAAMLLRSLGAKRTGTEQGIADYAFAVADALATLRGGQGPAGLADVFAAFAAYLK